MNTKYGITLSAPPPAYASLGEALAQNKTWKVLHIIGSNVSCLKKKRLSLALEFCGGSTLPNGVSGPVP
jgi:hypothetical protein